jgi:hypothetical protein
MPATRSVTNGQGMQLAAGGFVSQVAAITLANTVCKVTDWMVDGALAGGVKVVAAAMSITVASSVARR